MQTIIRLLLDSLFYFGCGVLLHVLFYRWVFYPLLAGEWKSEWRGSRWRGKFYIFLVNYVSMLLMGVVTYYIVRKVAENVRILIDIYFLLT